MQLLTFEVSNVSSAVTYHFEPDAAPIYGEEVYVDGFVFDRESRYANESFTEAARMELRRKLHPHLYNTAIQFNDISIQLTICRLEANFAGIGDPPKPIIGLLDFFKADEQLDKSSLNATIYIESKYFNRVQKLLLAIKADGSLRKEINLSLKEDLANWNLAEPIEITQFRVFADGNK